MPEPQHAVYVPACAVFPDIECDFETLRSLLQNLSRTETLVWCARLNLALSDREMDCVQRHAECIGRFLSPEEKTRVFAYAQRNTSREKRVVLFFRGQLLELMRWCTLYSQDLPGDGETFNDPEVRRRFSQAALICSDVLNVTVWGTDPVDDTADALLQGQVPDLSRKAAEATATTDLVLSLGRGWAYYRKYLPKHYPAFGKEFRRATGLSIEQYFACLAMVLVDSRRPPAHAGFRHGRVLQRTTYNEIFRHYIDLQSQTPGDLRRKWRRGLPMELPVLSEAPPFSRRPLLDRPILRTRHRQAIILDPLFFGESAVAGPLFHALRADPGRARRLFSAFGKAFEDYVNDILGRMFPASGLLTHRLHTNQIVVGERGRELEADACIIDVGRGVLVETKAAWMREDTILTAEHGPYTAFLRTNYVAPHGLQQLARIIHALSLPRQRKGNRAFNGVTLIYPVLVVRDQLLSTPYFGRFLHREFQDCLKPDEVVPSSGRMKKGDVTVTPPIVIDIETLEGLASCVSQHGFVDLLDEYSRECSDGATPLGNFIAGSPKYEPSFNPRESVGKEFVEALEATAREVFPEADLSGL